MQDALLAAPGDGPAGCDACTVGRTAAFATPRRTGNHSHRSDSGIVDALPIALEPGGGNTPPFSSGARTLYDATASVISWCIAVRIRATAAVATSAKGMKYV